MQGRDLRENTGLPMYRLLRLFRTSIGSKLMMALSGLVLVVFVTGHLIGNLKVFQGQDAINDYAAWLQGHPMLWVMRSTILAVFVLHVHTGIRLARANQAARPRRYRVLAYVETGIPARYMLFSGLLVLAFVLYHLAHLTVGLVQPQYAGLIDGAGRPDVYSRLVIGLSNPWLAAIYSTSVILLGLHLWHAVRSMLQTLGFGHQTWRRSTDIATGAFSAAVVAGFLSMPLAAQLGWLHLPASVAR